MIRKNKWYLWVSVSVLLVTIACSIGPYTITWDNDYREEKQAEDGGETSELGGEDTEEKTEEANEQDQETQIEETSDQAEETSMNSPAVEAGLELAEEYGGVLLDQSILSAEVDRVHNKLIIHRTMIVEISDGDEGFLLTKSVPDMIHHIPQWPDFAAENETELVIFFPSIVYNEEFMVYGLYSYSSEDIQFSVICFNWNKRTEEIIIQVDGEETMIFPDLLPDSDYLVLYDYSSSPTVTYYNLRTNKLFELPAPEGWEAVTVVGYLPENNSFVITANNNWDLSSCWLYYIDSGNYELLFDGWLIEVSPDNRLIIYTPDRLDEIAAQYRIFDIKERKDFENFELPMLIGGIGWAGSSERIFFTPFAPDYSSQIWLMNINDQNSQMVLDVSLNRIFWSNDGRYLVYWPRLQESGGYTIVDLEHGYSGIIQIEYEEFAWGFLGWEP